MNLPRNEYPRPQFVRKQWLCLNGQWQFEIDHNDSGMEQDFLNRPFKNEITVPFCPESKLSGIEHTGFMDAVWYRKNIEIPHQWEGKDTILHFQAVDYDTTVWVNGIKAGEHRGGWTGFECNLSNIAKAGDKIEIVVRARDLRTDKGKPGGKQCNSQYHNFGCFYNRTTGIWQTVWMEPVSKVHLKRPKITPDLSEDKFTITLPMTNDRAGTTVKASLKDEYGIITTSEKKCDSDFTPSLELKIPNDRKRLWTCDDPFLYNIDIELTDQNGKTLDFVQSYAGLRSVTIEGKAVKINGETIFQRLVLDQGYYEDGIMTAATDDELIKDIDLSLAAGFNGARLHQKTFEERFLYHCDRMGYLVWAEFGDWGIDTEKPHASYITQWLEILSRDFSHPSIIGWCGLNETRKESSDNYDNLTELTLGMFLAAKAMDPTRPVIDVSGFSHRLKESDIYDSHCYEQNPEIFKQLHSGLEDGKPYKDLAADGKGNYSVEYNGQPYFCSEFGGIKWCPETLKLNCRNTSWGYGEPPKTEEEFYERFEQLCKVLLDNPEMFGYCYTQLIDTYQEKNGLYYFDRRPKFDLDKIRQAQQIPAAIEKTDSKNTKPQAEKCLVS